LRIEHFSLFSNDLKMLKFHFSTPEAENINVESESVLNIILADSPAPLSLKNQTQFYKNFEFR